MYFVYFLIECRTNERTNIQIERQERIYEIL